MPWVAIARPLPYIGIQFAWINRSSLNLTRVKSGHFEFPYLHFDWFFSCSAREKSWKFHKFRISEMAYAGGWSLWRPFCFESYHFFTSEHWIAFHSLWSMRPPSARSCSRCAAKFWAWSPAGFIPEVCTILIGEGLSEARHSVVR